MEIVEGAGLSVVKGPGRMHASGGLALVKSEQCSWRSRCSCGGKSIFSRGLWDDDDDEDEDEDDEDDDDPYVSFEFISLAFWDGNED